ncbi:hypothetical protein SAMN05216350_104147 [Polaromonas sp. YR568]|uniref:hypothetical protein n=1 Tax=Polaromonas sp. YR568 TaxID=1855301 RepID=UPI0008E117E4|nr:hypothetical protein SAMN05216350_104147 [Polaromonas sp. YR568]
MANKPNTAKTNKQDTRGSARKPVDDGSVQDSTPKASGHGGKVENDFNQVGEQKPTQRNEGQRTANSRSDRESHVGGSNQLQSRRGGNSAR